MRMSDSLFDMRWISPLRKSVTKEEMEDSFFSELVSWGFRKVSKKEYIKDNDLIVVDSEKNSVELYSFDKVLYSGPVEFAEEFIGRFYN